MHLAWQIDDIRCLIFERLEARDLAQLAQTGQEMFDFATNEQWRTLHSVTPFIKCLSPDTTTRPIKAEDLCRLDFYSRKVQKIVLESKDIAKIIPLPVPFQKPRGKKKWQSEHLKTWTELWEEIASLRPPSEFLPNLRCLRVSNIVEELLLPFVGISAKSLTKLHIKYIQEKQSESVVVKLLSQLEKVGTPNLQYIFIRDGEGILPAKLITDSPLNHLRLDPRLSGGRHMAFSFKELPLRCEILEKSTIEHLTIGLSKCWRSQKIKSFEKKYLPALKTLWLNLTVHAGTGCLKDAGEQSPSFFFEGLDSPQLTLLNIKFPTQTSGELFIDIVSAAARNCRLDDLIELALAGGGWFSTCPECDKRPAPRILPEDLRKALSFFPVMTKLKVLRLSVAPNFLDILHLDLYHQIAEQLPALEVLHLGHPEFATSSEFAGTTYHERTPLHHLAAFCSLLPNLNMVSLGCGDGKELEQSPHPEWSCAGIKSLKIYTWARESSGRGVSFELLQLGLKTYFPNSDLTEKGYDPRTYWFQ